MGMADWIHKYPGVAALLQTDTDEVLGTSVEEDAAALHASPAVSPLQDLEAWYDTILRWGHACIRTYAAQGFFLCVAPDLYAVLSAHARPEWAPGPVHWRLVAPGGGRQLRLYALMEILPWPACPPGTWVAHWSDHAASPRIQAIPRGCMSWVHPRASALAPVGRTAPSGDEGAPICEAQRPALLCPCGGSLLRWL